MSGKDLVELTNHRKIPMNLHNRDGKRITLQPGETKQVVGDYDRFHKMMRKMNGLAVKKVVGKQRLVEEVEKSEGPRLAKVTNHKKIPMKLDTGVGHKRVNLEPGETSDPILIKPKAVKSINGVSVKYVVDEAEEKADDGTKADAEAAEAAAKAEEEAKAAAKAAEEEEARKDAESKDPKVLRREELSLPATREEWLVHKDQLTWTDVRSIAKELAISSKGANKETLLDAITDELYPDPEEASDSEE